MRPSPGFAALLLVLAGCVNPAGTNPPETPAAAPHLRCLAPDHCNFEATLTPETRQANELSIAVNPLNPDNVLATGKDYTPEEAGDCVWAGVYTTMDGGKTWKNQNVPGSPWKRLSDPTVPITDFSKFWCVTDPVVAFGPGGTAYWTVMPYQCDRASGSETGRGVLPKGGLNDWFWTCSAMYVLVSHDGGLTWPEWKEVAVGPMLEHDKQWIATAPNGNVLLCWDRSSDRVWTTGTDLDPAIGMIDRSSNQMVCSLSTDQGESWTKPTNLNDGWAGFTPAVDFGPDGTAYAVYTDGTSVLVSTSADGLAWNRPTVVGPYAEPPRGGEYAWPVLRGSAFRALTVPLLAVDRSAGPYSGSVYAIWFDHSAGEGDVWVAYSRDGARTWSPPARVHDDDPRLKADQFYPAISVGPDGTVDASWWDRRDDPANHLFHLYYAASHDGGATWTKNLRVSEEASDEQYSHHQNGMIFLGDYRDQDSSVRGAHLVWVDTRNEKADVFTATVER